MSNLRAALSYAPRLERRREGYLSPRSCRPQASRARGRSAVCTGHRELPGEQRARASLRVGVLFAVRGSAPPPREKRAPRAVGGQLPPGNDERTAGRLPSKRAISTLAVYHCGYTTLCMLISLPQHAGGKYICQIPLRQYSTRRSLTSSIDRNPQRNARTVSRRFDDEVGLEAR